MCVGAYVPSWMFIVFLLSNFDDTAAIKGQERLCIFPVFFWDCPNAEMWKLRYHKYLCVLLWYRWVNWFSTCIYLKTELNGRSVGVWFTSSNMHLLYRNLILQVPVGKPWKMQCRAQHLHCKHTTLLNHVQILVVTSDLFLNAVFL